MTPEEIKRAYRKTATRVHPDRNRGDPEATERFQEVQYAYSVLSDPRLRGIYDSYGEQGLKMYESYTSFAESDGGPNLPAGDPVQLITMLCCAVAVIVALITALSVDVYLKLQVPAVDAPLYLMLIPLWILNAIGLIVLSVFISAGYKKGGGFQAVQGPLGLLAQLLLLIVWEVLLVVRTDRVSFISYAAVFAPLYIMEALSYARASQRISKVEYEGERASGRTLLTYNVHVMRVLGEIAARAAFLVLLVLHLDGIVVQGWWLVLLPLWLLLALFLALAFMQAAVPPSSEQEQMAALLNRGKIFALLFLALILLLANLVLDGGISSWLPIFIFIFIVAGCFFCCCTCAVCALRMQPRPAAQDVPPRDDGYGVNVGASTDRSSGSTAGGNNSSMPGSLPTSSRGATSRSAAAAVSGHESPNESAPLLDRGEAFTPGLGGRYRTGNTPNSPPDHVV